MTEPTPRELRELRRRAAGIRAQIHVGRAGLSDAVVSQIAGALEQRELVKVRVVGADRTEVEATGQELARRLACTLVGRVGFVLTLYRPRNDGPEPPGTSPFDQRPG